MQQPRVSADRLDRSRHGDIAIRVGDFSCLKFARVVCSAPLSLGQVKIQSPVRLGPFHAEVRRRLLVRIKRHRDMDDALAGLARELAFHLVGRDDARGERAVVVVHAQRQHAVFERRAAERLAIGTIHQRRLQRAIRLLLQIDDEVHLTGLALNDAVPLTDGSLRFLLREEREGQQQNRAGEKECRTAKPDGK